MSQSVSRVLVGCALMMVGLGFGSALAGQVPMDVYRVGVLYRTLDGTAAADLRQGIESEVARYNSQAAETGAPLVKLLPPLAGDQAGEGLGQGDQMDSLLDQHPHLILAQPVDGQVLAAGLLRANRERVPVVALQEAINGPGKASCLLKGDDFEAGFQCGEYLAAQYPDSKTLVTILLEHSGSASATDRVQGFEAGLKAHQQPFNVVRTYQAFDETTGSHAGNMILRQHPMPHSLDVVFAANGEAGMAAVQALLEKNREDLAVAMVGGGILPVESVRAGSLVVVDAALFPRQLGLNAIRFGLQILQGRDDLPPTIILPVFPVTRETMAQFGNGIPQAFTKPWPSTEPHWRWQVTNDQGAVLSLQP